MSTALNATIIPFPAARTHVSQATVQQAPAGGKTRMHITRRGRIVLTTLAAVPVVIAAVLFAIGGGTAFASNDASHATSFSHVTVSSGQSLWQIAERIAPSADPRDVVSAIVDLNQLSTAMVMPGQRLAIPTEYSH